MESHEILGISKDASEQEIRLAYKGLAMKWHPDRQPLDKAGATAKFVEINRAHRTMLRNLRRTRRTTKAKECFTTESSPSSPESTSSSLPESSTHSTHSSTSRSSSPSESPGSSRSPSISSFTSGETSPTRSSFSEDKYKTRGRFNSRSTDFPNPLQPSSADTLPSRLSTESSSTSSSNPGGRKLRKRTRSKNRKVNTDSREDTPKHSPRQGGPHIDSDLERVAETLCPSRAVLRGAGADVPKKWVHLLNLTLEEIVQGKTFHFRVIRYTRSGKQVLPLEVHVPSGSRGGTEIILEGVGNERKDGTWQDISFTIKEMKHDRFTRIHDDLFMDVRLPWVDSLNDREGKVYLQGLDQSDYLFTVNYHSTRLLSGKAVIHGAGMPYLDGTGRGRIIVRWEISSPLSSWDAIKNVLRFRN
ncbi:hypothetical protein CPB84DRAFT_1764094 [Gymnopilus junonius]|uniref:J domain-containing protein n=1 Tax=Gymnopilus junonius TaxID=109634 RepID=A0A9P5NY27_GYMJU|nr:hypothetical protein CPB84DRAFT_1764094 [Gymnopilus junonius]